MLRNSQPFSSVLLLFKSGNVEFLGHRKGHGINYFSGHGVIIIRMLRISHKLCLIIKEFEETFKSMKASWFQREHLKLRENSTSRADDRRGVSLR